MTARRRSAVDYASLDAVVDQLEYKAGYDFRRNGDQLEIEWWAPDSEDGYGADAPEMKCLLFSCPLPPAARSWPTSTAMAWIRHRVRDLECHEADEWLRVNGERVFDPHTGRRAYAT